VHPAHRLSLVSPFLSFILYFHRGSDFLAHAISFDDANLYSEFR